MFPDIEGSTRLLQQLRDDYPEVLAQHRRLIREAFGEREGEESTSRATGSFSSSLARTTRHWQRRTQRSLPRYDWPDGVEVRVRIGMHTGETISSADGYYGVGIHRAARIMAAAHGGQVLLSRATSSVLEDDELPGLS